MRPDCPCSCCVEWRRRMADVSGSLDNESIAHDSTKLTLSQVDAELTRLRERLAAETGRADSGERTIQELFKLLAAVEGERDEARFERDSYIAAHNELEEQLREAPVLAPAQDQKPGGRL